MNETAPDSSVDNEFLFLDVLLEKFDGIRLLQPFLKLAAVFRRLRNSSQSSNDVGHAIRPLAFSESIRSYL